MYRLMKSEKVVLNHSVSGRMVSYRHREVRRYDHFPAAFAACQSADNRTNAHHYILDGAGKEYYAGIWVD